MFSQTRQYPFTESDSLCLGFPRGAGSDGKAPEWRGLPSFVSSEPPRSEGEALLRRIFSRGPSPSRP
jgi:hypothetical protein